MSHNLFFFAGDTSGDYNSSLLVRELLKRHPDWHIRALGGGHLKAAGAEIVGDTSNLGVIGIAAALATLPRQLAMKRRALASLKASRADLAILCDWGGFNVRMVPELKALGIPVLYTFPPRSWQKQGDAGLAIATQCQAIATPFPWSAERLNAAGGKATWVGHPILETGVPIEPREALRKELCVGQDETMVALLPGSRPLELRYIAPHVAEAIRIVNESRKVHWVAVAAPGKADVLRKHLGKLASVYEGPAARALAACDAALVKSGTSTLEAAVAGAPQVVLYEGPALLHLQARLTGLEKKFRYFSLPNIIVDRQVVTELMGPRCRGPIIAAELIALLDEASRREEMRLGYAQMREALGENLPYTAIDRTANLVEETLLAPE